MFNILLVSGSKLAATYRKRSAAIEWVQQKGERVSRIEMRMRASFRDMAVDKQEGLASVEGVAGVH